MKCFTSAVYLANLSLSDGQPDHVLRHIFATCCLASGGDILELKEMLG